MDDPLVGKTINGKFRIVAPIGRGGMGSVYRAEQLPLGRVVALKVLRNRPGMKDIDPAFQRRFFLEASLCAKLSHPNIVTIYDYGRIEGAEDEAYFMAMELLEGETLHARLRARGGPLTVSESVVIAVEVARGLREAHKNGIVHRDLKPGNVMLVPGEDGHEKVKILDFGLVKQVDSTDTEDLTQEGSFLGSPKYMSPEQIDHNQVDHRTDLYSLGAMLYQCLCGRVPFDAPSAMQILIMHVSSPVPAMSERTPGVQVPPPVEALVDRLLAKRAADRPATADDVIREARRLQASLGLNAVPGTDTRTGGAIVGDVMSADPSGSLVGASVSGSRSGSRVSTGRRVPLIAGLVAAGVLGIGGAIVLAVRGNGSAAPHPPVAAANASGHAPTPVPTVTPANTVVPSPPPVATTHRLHIVSVPAGAVVSENGHPIGPAPIDITMNADQRDARHFELTLDGYQPLPLDQPPIVADTEVRAPLSAVARPPIETTTARSGSSHTSSGHHGGHASNPATNPAQPGNGRPPLDIVTER